MYGDAAYTVIDGVRQLPLKISDIYRRLTTRTPLFLCPRQRYIVALA